MDDQFLQGLILALPNWVGFLLLVAIQNRFNQRLLLMIEKRLEQDQEDRQEDRTIIRRDAKM